MMPRRPGSTSTQYRFSSGGRPTPPFPEALACILIVALVAGAGCAPGHAGQSSAESPPGGDEQAAEPSSESTDAGQSEHQTKVGESGENPDEASACGVETFQLHFFDESTRITQTVDCKEREVVEVRRSSFDQKRRKAAENAGLPRNTWYLLVDPKGLRPDFLSDEQIIRLSREYDLRFLGRDTDRGLLIYEYRVDL